MDDIPPASKEPLSDDQLGAESAQVAKDTRPDKPPILGVVISVLFTAAVLLWSAWQQPEVKSFIIEWWWQVLVGGVLLIIVLVCLVLRQWYAKTTVPKQTGIIVFVVIPCVLGGILTIVWLPTAYQIVVTRAVFLVAVCLFPGLIYYLFIATRKISLLNDYFINLGRLGLLQRRPSADPDTARAECRVRVLNYLQKFEGLYGALPPDLESAIVNADDPLVVLAAPKWRESVASGGIATIFTGGNAIPVVLATVLIALGWLLALPPPGVSVFSVIPDWKGQAFWSMAFDINETPIIYAFLGAYFFSLQMLFRRYVREDLRKTAYLAVSLRIILAVIGTWAATMAMKGIGKAPTANSYLLVIGFVIGVFPRIAWQFIEGATKRALQKFGMSAVLPSMQSRLPVSDLDGLTVWHEARLEEEDIENIPNMATADIVDLMISTRFPPERIIDWVDQAILFTHLGPSQKDGNPKCQTRRDQLRLQGIRTATSLIQAFQKAQEKGRKDGQEVEKILSLASGGHVRSLLDAIQTEGNLSLILAWRGLIEPGASSCRA